LVWFFTNWIEVFLKYGKKKREVMVVGGVVWRRSSRVPLQITLSFFHFFNYELHAWIFLYFLILKIHSCQLLKLCGVTRRIDQVKIGVLQKGLNMRGVFCHFF